MAEHQSRNQDHQKAFNPPGVMEPYNHDLDLKTQVKNALLTETESAGIDVQVSSEDGVIRLHGVVDVLSHKTVAEEIARRIPGVTKVENDLTVANEETATDKDILQAITTKLGHGRETNNIGARVHKGVVTLVGHAGSQDDVRAAVALVEDMAGVREVKIGRVKIGEGQKEDDADVSRQAERVLEQMGFDHNLFEVYCDAGVLFVKGFVPTREDRSQVKIAMHKIPGVDKLEALLITDDEYGGEIH
jgi:hyperosmotically inducible periplasmic protein